MMLSCVILIILGNFLWFGVIHYEKFGGDPQKRSLTNQLTSHAAIFVLFWMNATLLTHFLRALFGCLPFWLGYSVIWIRRFCFTTCLMYIVEILGFKLLLLISFSTMSGLNENFYSVFLILFNSLWSFILVSSWAYLIPIDWIFFFDYMVCTQHVQKKRLT